MTERNTEGEHEDLGECNSITVVEITKVVQTFASGRAMCEGGLTGDSEGSAHCGNVMADNKVGEVDWGGGHYC